LKKIQYNQGVNQTENSLHRSFSHLPLDHIGGDERSPTQFMSDTKTDMRYVFLVLWNRKIWYGCLDTTFSIVRWHMGVDELQCEEKVTLISTWS